MEDRRVGEVGEVGEVSTNACWLCGHSDDMECLFLALDWTLTG